MTSLSNLSVFSLSNLPTTFLCALSLSLSTICRRNRRMAFICAIALHHHGVRVSAQSLYDTACTIPCYVATNIFPE